MVAFRELLIIGLVVTVFLTPKVAFGDPSWWNQLEVQGAHVVSEGAYFRFLVVNHYPTSIYVGIVNDSEPVSVVSPGDYLDVEVTDYIYILSNASANFDVIAPNAYFPYRVVTYTIVQALGTPISEHWTYLMKFQVIVLASGFVQVLSITSSPIFSIALIAIGVILTNISLIRWKRSRSNLEGAR